MSIQKRTMQVLQPAASFRWAAVLVVMMASGCKQEWEKLYVSNQTPVDVTIYRGATMDPSRSTASASAGEGVRIPYGATEKWFFGLFDDHPASFRREFAAGLTVADTRGRSAYFSLADLQKRCTHPKASYYQLEIDVRDFPP
jgi:hypothetical protein